MSAEWTLKVALNAAAILIEGAGLKLKHASSSGSRYYHLSGRLGLLRLADHCKETTADVTAMLIINAASMPRDERKLRRMVAEAIGRYMLDTEVKTYNGAADAEPEMAEPFPNRTWPWRMEDCDEEAAAERHRQCHRVFQEIERLRASVRWHRSVLSRTEISAAIAADAAMPKEPSGE